MTPQDARERIRTALLTRHQPALDDALIDVNFALGPVTTEVLAVAELVALPPDVQAYWLAPCDPCRP